MLGKIACEVGEGVIRGEVFKFFFSILEQSRKIN